MRLDPILLAFSIAGLLAGCLKTDRASGSLRRGS